MMTADDTAVCRLRRIADALRIPVEALFDAAEPRRLADASECVHLWNRLRTEASRAAVLDYLRKVLDAEGA